MRTRSGLLAMVLTSALTISTAGQQSTAGSDFYEVDLSSGVLSRVGSIGDGMTLVGLALPSRADSSEAHGLTVDGELVRFERDDPSEILDRVEITGLGSGEALVGIDFRPATGELFGISDGSVIYVIDPESGEANAVDGSFDPALENVDLGFDFNPTVDRIRVDVSSGQNLRLNPDTGSIGTNPDTGEPTIDGQLAYAAGDENEGARPGVVGAGYTNSVDGAESTELYVIDAELDVLASQDPPNDGVLNTIGELGVDASEATAFDISPEGDAFAAIAAAGDDDDQGDADATAVVDVDADVTAAAVVDAGATVDADADVDATVAADVDATVEADLNVDAGIDAEATVEAEVDATVAVEADVEADATLEATPES